MYRFALLFSVIFVAGVISAAYFLPHYFMENSPFEQRDESSFQADLEERNQKENVKRLQTVAAALEKFRTDCGFYPSNKQGLDALLKKPSNCKKWGPESYLQFPTCTTDQYGNRISYKRNGKRFVVVSLGKDRQPGGEGENSDHQEKSP